MSNKNNKQNKQSEYEGIYRCANKSFGFVKILNDTNNNSDIKDINNANDIKEEIFVRTMDSLDALDGDKVLVKINNNNNDYIFENKHREGKIIKIISRENDTVVGIFESNKNYGFVVPMNKKIPFDLHIEKKFFNNAVTGSIVLAKLLPAVHKKDNPEGMVLEVIGHKDDPNDEITAIVKNFRIKDKFSNDVLNEANDVALSITENDIVGRVDLRNKNFITIDGEDTKDIDDAIFLETFSNGNTKLYVSIADVAHYVKEDSYIDKEALARGNSVYLIDRVIPMISHILSNGMCSLNENEDRLAMTCEMEYDSKGKQIRHNIYKSIIKSVKRTTYNEVQNLWDNNENTTFNEELRKMLFDMRVLSRILRKIKTNRGSINFNIKETYIEVDEKLNPINIKEKERLEAHELIEDFMVAANETIAEEYFFREIPFLYRTHEICDDDKIKDLAEILENIGINFTYRGKIQPKEIQNLLKSIEGTPYQYVVEKLALRSMSQAKYTKKALGHFALASKYYTHWTSPIRRYNDLQIHRIIKEVLDGKYDSDREKHYESILDDVALNISKTERTAIDCERDIDDLKKCQFMVNKLGEEFEGVISGLTNFGIFVELSNTIEGMVALREMRDDYYIFDEKHLIVYGERTGKTYKFGQSVKVQLVKVITDIRAIDFIMLE